MANVELEHLTKIFDDGVCAVDGLNLSIPDGELLVLVGSSGSGKTTVLRLIAGLEAPTAGTVSIAGRPVTTLPPWQRNVALVFQQPALYPHLNVAANLRFSVEQRQRPVWLRRLAMRWLQPRRWREHRDRETALQQSVAAVAGQLSISGLLQRYPAQLSGGEQQRVALGRALVRQPAVLLLDEPFSHLDTRLRQELRDELHLLHRRSRATILFITHDPQEALALGDRVAVLHQGVLEQVAEPRRLYEQPASRRVAEFLGWPDGNFLEGVLFFEQQNLYFISKDLRWPLPSDKTSAWSAFTNRPVLLGLPPESVCPAGEVGHPLDMEVVQCTGFGANALLTWRTHGIQVQGRQGNRVESGSLVQGQKVMVRLRLEVAQLFDATTGLALVSGRATV